MTQEIHLLPIGFDIHRLTAPFTARESQFNPDRVILLQSTQDVSDESTAEKPRRTKLANNALEETSRTIEDQLQISTEVKSIPALDQYNQIFESAFALLDDLVSQKDETEENPSVYVNISSLPTGAATAFANAATSLTAENPRKGERIKIYYIPPQEYAETQLIEFIEDVHERLQWGFDIGREYRYPIEDGLYTTISELLKWQIEGIQSTVNEISRVLENSGFDEEQRHISISQAKDNIQELLDYATYYWLPYEDGFDPGESEIHREKYYEEDVEEEIDALEERTERVRQVLNEARQEVDTVEGIERAISSLDTLESAFPGYAQLQRWAAHFHSITDEIGSAQETAEKLLDDIDRYGMTKGLTKPQGEIQMTISQPPISELRTMELLVMYELSDAGEVGSIGSMAKRIASSLRGHLESFSLSEERFSDTTPEFVIAISEKITNRNEEEILDELESTMAQGIRSRLQYNLQSLDDKQYIRRPSGEDKRRARILLTETGKQWTKTHDLSRVCRKPMEEVLAKEIKKFTE